MSAPASRIDLRTKLAYGVSDVGASLSYSTTNTWLLFYLVNAIGLAPVVAGFVFILGRGFDALLDPWWGARLDRRLARGRLDRVAQLRRFALPLGGAFALMWVLPEGSPFWLAALPFLAYSFLFTVVQVPYLALTPDLAPNYDDRTELTGVRVAFSIVASLVAAAVPPVLVVAASGGAASVAASGAAAWRPLALVLGVATAVPYLVTGIALRDPRAGRDRAAPTPPAPPVPPVEGDVDAVGEVGGARSLIREARSALQRPGYLALLAIFVAITLGLMVVSSMLPFYLEGALRLAPGDQTLVLGLLFGAAAVAFPLWSRLSAATGKRTALVTALVVLAAADVALVAFAPPERLGIALLGFAALAGAALAGAMLLPWAILPDLVDRDALDTGRRRDAFLYALFTFAQKGAGSVGVFANGLAATLFGWVAGAALQPDAAIAGVRLMVGPVAAGLFLAAAVLTLLAPLSRAATAGAAQVD